MPEQRSDDTTGPAHGGSAPLHARIERLRDRILAICADHGASNVCVFGSVARRDSSGASDVDFLVDLDPDRSLLDHIALQQELEDLLDAQVDVVTRRALHPLLRENVLADAVPV